MDVLKIKGIIVRESVGIGYWPGTDKPGRR